MCPSPLDSGHFDEFFDTGNTSFFDHFERRIAAGKFAMEADGDPQSGLLAIWCRIKGAPITGAATQGFVADLGPLAVCARLGIAPGGTSLDNTVRVVDPRADRLGADRARGRRVPPLGRPLDGATLERGRTADGHCPTVRHHPPEPPPQHALTAVAAAPGGELRRIVTVSVTIRRDFGLVGG